MDGPCGVHIGSLSRIGVVIFLLLLSRSRRKGPKLSCDHELFFVPHFLNDVSFSQFFVVVVASVALFNMSN